MDDVDLQESAKKLDSLPDLSHDEEDNIQIIKDFKIPKKVVIESTDIHLHGTHYDHERGVRYDRNSALGIDQAVATCKRRGFVEEQQRILQNLVSLKESLESMEKEIRVLKQKLKTFQKYLKDWKSRASSSTCIPDSRTAIPFDSFVDLKISNGLEPKVTMELVDTTHHANLQKKTIRTNTTLEENMTISIEPHLTRKPKSLDLTETEMKLRNVRQDTEMEHEVTISAQLEANYPSEDSRDNNKIVQIGTDSKASDLICGNLKEHSNTKTCTNLHSATDIKEKIDGESKEVAEAEEIEHTVNENLTLPQNFPPPNFTRRENKTRGFRRYTSPTRTLSAWRTKSLTKKLQPSQGTPRHLSNKEKLSLGSVMLIIILLFALRNVSWMCSIHCIRSCCERLQNRQDTKGNFKTLVQRLTFSLVSCAVYQHSQICVYPVHRTGCKQNTENGEDDEEDNPTANNYEPRAVNAHAQSIVQTENTHILTHSHDEGHHSSCIVPSGQTISPNDRRYTLPPGSLLVPSGRSVSQEETSFSGIPRSSFHRGRLLEWPDDVLVISGHGVGSDIHINHTDALEQDRSGSTIKPAITHVSISSPVNTLAVCRRTTPYFRVSRILRVVPEINNEPMQSHPGVPSQGNGYILSPFFNMRMTNLCTILPFLVAVTMWLRDTNLQLLFETASGDNGVYSHESNPYAVLRQIGILLNAVVPDFGHAIALWVRRMLFIEILDHREMTTYSMFNDQHTYVTSAFIGDNLVNCSGVVCTECCIIAMDSRRSDASFYSLLSGFLQQRCDVCEETRSTIIQRYRPPLIFINLAGTSFSSSQEIPSTIHIPGCNRVLNYRRILVTFHRSQHFTGLIWLQRERCLAMYDCNEMHPSNPEYGVLRHYDQDPTGATMQLAIYALQDSQLDT